jgi:hypothetical protein
MNYETAAAVPHTSLLDLVERLGSCAADAETLVQHAEGIADQLGGPRPGEDQNAEDPSNSVLDTLRALMAALEYKHRRLRAALDATSYHINGDRVLTSKVGLSKAASVDGTGFGGARF